MPGVSTDRRLGVTTDAAIKVACKAATTANITLSGEQTIDGVACVTDDRVLVKNQTNSADNGIYVVDTSSWERATDFDGTLDVIQGTIIPVYHGAGTLALYAVSSATPITYDTTAITFETIGSDNIALQALLASTSDVSSGDALMGVKRTDTGAAATTQHALNDIREVDAQVDYLAAADGTTNDTAALIAAYAAAKVRKTRLRLRAGTYKITSQLVWDGSVDVLGDGEYTIIKAYGNFDPIKITTVAQESRYENFSVLRGSGTGNGIWVHQATHATFDRVKSRGHSGHNWYLYNATDPTGFFTHYINCSASLSGGDGWYVYNHWRSFWTGADNSGNTGYGMNFELGNYHTGTNTQCANGNVLGGYRFNTAQNNFDIYGESNVGPDLTLTASSARNINTIVNVDTTADIVDLGTDNQQPSMSGLLGLLVRRISRAKRTTNVAGLPLSIVAGAAGAGASPFAGGPLLLAGGDADGTGNSRGGIVQIRGGSSVGTSRDGTLELQFTGAPIMIGASGEPDNESISVQFNGTTRVPRMPKLTTAQKNALTVVNGMGPIFDTDLGKVQVTEGGVWVSVI